MENASKALMIAGGILLAILTLSLVVIMMNSISSMADTQDAKTLTEQKIAFNKEYEAYNKRRMYGTDVLTVVNKAENNNLKNEDQVNIYVIDKSGNNIDVPTDEEELKTFKNGFFECTNIQYDENTGKVNSMTFRQRDIKRDTEPD